MTDRSLKDFAKWYIEGKEGVLNTHVPERALRVGPMSTEFVLYREPPFQVTLVTFFPGYEVPVHSHRYVSSYDFILHGDGHAFVAGRHWTKKTQSLPQMNTRIAVPAGVTHHGRTDTGAVFLSVQKWEGREPGFLSDDWVADAPFKDVPRDKA